MPNIITVPVSPSASETERIDAALGRCEGDYVAIVPHGFPIRQMWIEDSLYALINTSAQKAGFELEGSTDSLPAIVLEKIDLLNARRSFPNLPVLPSLKAAGITIRRILPDEIPFQIDTLLEQGHTAEKSENWAQAAEIFEHIAENYQNELWMKALAARALFKSGNYARADELSSEINRQRPTVNTLLLEAKLKRKKKNFRSAVQLLKRAEKILEGPFIGAPENRMCGGKNCYGHN
jgi:tetratricopeptide (TPR) repeat protein